MTLHLIFFWCQAGRFLWDVHTLARYLSLKKIQYHMWINQKLSIYFNRWKFSLQIILTPSAHKFVAEDKGDSVLIFVFISTECLCDAASRKERRQCRVGKRPNKVISQHSPLHTQRLIATRRDHGCVSLVMATSTMMILEKHLSRGRERRFRLVRFECSFLLSLMVILLLK